MGWVGARIRVGVRVGVKVGVRVGTIHSHLVTTQVAEYRRLTDGDDSDMMTSGMSHSK